MAFLSFLEKLKIISIVLKNEAYAKLNIGLSTFHNVKDISKCKLRLYHPKLSHMPTSMRDLSSKGRPEIINI